MMLAENEIIPPKQWYHNPRLRDKCDISVADCLRDNDIEVPPEWNDE